MRDKNENVFTISWVPQSLKCTFRFSEVSTRAGLGGTIYSRIMREAYNIFYGLVILMQSLFYSLFNLLH